MKNKFQWEKPIHIVYAPNTTQVTKEFGYGIRNIDGYDVDYFVHDIGLESFDLIGQDKIKAVLN